MFRLVVWSQSSLEIAKNTKKMFALYQDFYIPQKY